MKHSLLLALSCLPLAAAPADVVFINGNIYTANDRQPRAEAIAVKGDRIVFVGANSDAKSYLADGARGVDLHGQTVLPGLTDAHCHIFGVGEREMNLNLEGTRTSQLLRQLEQAFLEEGGLRERMTRARLTERAKHSRP